jgi:hypothetical protein
LVVVAVLYGCGVAGGPLPPAELLVIAGVPAFEAQARDDDCAAVALASLLGHAGVLMAPAVIDAAVYDPRLGGALLPDLERFAVGAGGVRTHSGRGTVGELQRLLRAGHPVLVPIDIGWSLWRRPHYVVLHGFGDAGFLMHLRRGETRVMPVAEFERRWALLGRLYLYLEP